MPKFGFSTSCLAPMDLLDQIDFAHHSGLDAIEIFGDTPQWHPSDPIRYPWPEVRRKLRRFQIEAAMHAPFYGTNISSLNDGIRRESVLQVKQSIDLIAYLEGTVVVFHPGTHSGVKFDGPEQAWQRTLESVQELADYARSREVYLGLENLGMDEEKEILYSNEQLLRMVEQVGEPYLGITLDNGHANVHGSMVAAFQELGPQIRHVHFSDNHGVKDEHLPVGHGSIEYAPIAAYLKQHPYQISMELTDPADKEEGVRRSIRLVKELIAN